MGIVATRLLDEHNNIQRSKLDRELQNGTDQELFSQFLQKVRDMPFDQYCDLLDKHSGNKIQPL